MSFLFRAATCSVEPPSFLIIDVARCWQIDRNEGEATRIRCCVRRCVACSSFSTLTLDWPTNAGSRGKGAPSLEGYFQWPRHKPAAETRVLTFRDQGSRKGRLKTGAREPNKTRKAARVQRFQRPDSVAPAKALEAVDEIRDLGRTCCIMVARACAARTKENCPFCLSHF